MAKATKASESVDPATVSQDTDAKPSREELARSGYVIPPHFEDLENGDEPGTAAKAGHGPSENKAAADVATAKAAVSKGGKK